MLKKIDKFLQKGFQNFTDFIYYNFGINNFQIAFALIWLGMFFRIYGGYDFYLKDKTKIFFVVMIMFTGISMFVSNYHYIKIAENSAKKGYKNPIRGIGLLKIMAGTIIVFDLISFVFKNRIPYFFEVGFFIDFLFYYFVCCQLPRVRKNKKKPAYT